MLKTVLFILYSAAIPVVPLMGAEYYKKQDNSIKRLCCWGLFVLQSLISLGSIIGYLQTD